MCVMLCMFAASPACSIHQNPLRPDFVFFLVSASRISIVMAVWHAGRADLGAGLLLLREFLAGCSANSSPIDPARFIVIVESHWRADLGRSSPSSRPRPAGYPSLQQDGPETPGGMRGPRGRASPPSAPGLSRLPPTSTPRNFEIQVYGRERWRRAPRWSSSKATSRSGGPETMGLRRRRAPRDPQVTHGFTVRFETASILTSLHPRCRWW